MSCIFCQIVKGIIPSIRIAENELSIAFLDINPLSAGHVLIIPKAHYSFFHQMDEKTVSEVSILANKVAAVYGKRGIQYNVLQNNGKLAHQEIEHVHFHIIPKRNENEGLQIGWNSQSISKEYLNEYAQTFRQEMEQ